MALVFLVICWSVASILVARLIVSYRNPQSTHATILAAVFLSWLFPMSITFLLPIDVSSTRYEQCLAGDGDPANCLKSFLYVPAGVRHVSWLVVYWATFFLSWVIVPFLQGYVVAGQFTLWGKTGYALKINLIFYGAGIAILGVLVVYLWLGTTTNTFEGIKALLMALTNAIGLLAAIIFLGHGLVRIPRRLWHSANSQRQLRKAEAKALKCKEALSDAEEELATLTRTIQGLPFRARHRPELQGYVDELLSAAPVPSDSELLRPRMRGGSNIRDEDGRGGPPSLERLEELNYQIRDAISRRDRLAWQWRTLLEEAWYWQDVLTNRHAGHALGWRSSVEAALPTTFQRHCRWWWRVALRPVALRMGSVLCVLLSFIVFWSEVTLPVTGADLSLIRPLVGLRLGTVEALTAGMLVYVALCTFSSFMKLRVLHYFCLVPGQHTDDKSLLFFAAYITRLTLPLGYNYLGLVDRSLKTEFAKVMGTMDLVPLLGRFLDFYVPVSLSLTCLLVVLKVHKQVSSHSRVDEEDLVDGRDLIAQARRQEERENQARVRLYASSSSNFLGLRFVSRSQERWPPSHSSSSSSSSSLSSGAAAAASPTSETASIGIIEGGGRSHGLSRNSSPRSRASAQLSMAGRLYHNINPWASP